MNLSPVKIVSVLGCGWMGFPLAELLLRKGYVVKGSTTSPGKVADLESAGVRTYQLNFDPELSQDPADFFEADALFLNIPFRRSLPDPRFYFDQIDAAAKAASAGGVKRIIFASSTSVYPDDCGDVLEDTGVIADNARARVLREAEEMLLNHQDFQTVVLRFAGLYGGERQLGRFAGAVSQRNPESPVNLIHLEDCITIISLVLENDSVWGEVFNVCSDHHPSRQELYSKAAAKMGLPEPVFSGKAPKVQKIVNNNKIKRVLNYHFKYPDPLETV